MIAAGLLIAAGLVLFYVMVGYPLLLAAYTRRAAPAVRKDLGFRPTATVVLAVHNGEEFIRAKLESLAGLDYPAGLVDILVVSDGSTDRTDAMIAAFAASPAGSRVRLLRAPRGGKAAALNLGIEHASGEILFFTDVRQPIHPAALSHLAANFADPTVGAVTGELRMLDPNRSGEQADMELYWRYELWARRQHSRRDSIFAATDVTSWRFGLCRCRLWPWQSRRSPCRSRSAWRRRRLALPRSFTTDAFLGFWV